MDIELKEMEERIVNNGKGTIDLFGGNRCQLEGPSRRKPRESVPDSTPYKSSSDRPVSLQVGNGTYCSCPSESVIWKE